MDIVLERILTLIPKKENGAFKHGALSQFARSLGFKDGHIVSDWIAGNSESYKNYLYQIAAKYDVSVEWLRGETDEKAPTETSEREFVPSYEDWEKQAENWTIDQLDNAIWKLFQIKRKREGKHGE